MRFIVEDVKTTEHQRIRISDNNNRAYAKVFSLTARYMLDTRQIKPAENMR